MGNIFFLNHSRPFGQNGNVYVISWKDTWVAANFFRKQTRQDAALSGAQFWVAQNPFKLCKYIRKKDNISFRY